MQRTPVHSKTVVISILLLMFLGFVWIVPFCPEAHTLQDEGLPNVGVDEKLNAQVPLGLTFTDQDGRQVRLGDYLKGGPIILTLNYYSCPMLCPLIFRNLAGAVNTIKGVSLAKDYRIVTVSIDPEETLERAHEKAGETWRMVQGVADPGKRWPFLLGQDSEIRQLTGVTGVRYTRLGKNNFAHPSVFIVLTPSGKVARYLYGIEQRPADLKLALIEAAEGRIGGSEMLNRALLYCYHYDPVGKKYALAALRIMNTSAAVVGILLGGLLFSLWRREKKAAKEKTHA